MAKRHLHQKIRTRNFQARNERIEQPSWLELTMKNVSVFFGNQENAISRKQKDSVQKQTLAASATMRVSPLGAESGLGRV